MTTPCRVACELHADLRLLVRREHVDDAVDGLRRRPWVCSVPNTRWPVSAAVSAVWIVSQVAHLADEDHVGVLAQHVAQGRANDGVSAPTSRWLIIECLWLWMNSIGSSTVRMCSRPLAR